MTCRFVDPTRAPCNKIQKRDGNWIPREARCSQAAACGLLIAKPILDTALVDEILHDHGQHVLLAGLSQSGCRDIVAKLAERGTSPRHAPKVLLIEDSIHYQNLVRLLVQEHFPEADLHVANEGFSGLAMLGMFDPEVLLLDMMLPGMDGSSLIGALRATPSFAHVQLIVITSMSAEELQKRSLVLKGVTVVPKTELMSRLPTELAQVLGRELERAGQHL